MKSKSSIAALLLAVFTLGWATSCEDMFDIDSNRVVYDHDIKSTADSVYTTLGILTCMREVADRYVILGEVRGDMADINKNTKASLRSLATFDFDDYDKNEENEYLNVRDYYAIINNCNYALANMDAGLTLSNKLVMMDEYVAILGIRAWTYLQLAINYGDIYYYTYPVVSESDVEKAKAEGKKNIKDVAADLALQLTPYLDYDMPSFVSTQKYYPLLRLVQGDLYLWSGDYTSAIKCYEDFFMKNKKYSFTAGKASEPGYMNLGGYFQKWKDADKKMTGNLENYVEEVSEDEYSTFLGDENFSFIINTSELPGLFVSGDDSHHLNPSAAWHTLSSQQVVFSFIKGDGKTTLDSVYKNKDLGELRKYRYYEKQAPKDIEEFGVYLKHSGTGINYYRRSLACLRWAEAMNAQAQVLYSADENSSEARKNAVNAFYLLKDASRVFFPDSSEVMKRFLKAADNEDQWRTPFMGVHGRGCGDVRHDTLIYVLKPAVIANRLKKNASDIDFSDTIEYIDELIIDELALESTLEGNRFGDLVRFAKRREAWTPELYDINSTNYRHFLAKRVSERGGEDTPEEERQTLYNKLNESEKYWYLPFQ